MVNDLLTEGRSSFMGLWETMVWVGTRNESFVEEVRLSAQQYQRDELGAGAFSIDALIRYNYDSQLAFAAIADKCAMGELVAKGRNAEGTQSIPADHWHEASFMRAGKPDTIVSPAGSVFGDYFCWEKVCFVRAESFRQWPANTGPSSGFAPCQRKKGGGPKPREYASPLADLFRKQHDLIADLSERRRHEYVTKTLPCCVKPGSARTTERHWKIHLAQRARLT